VNFIPCLARASILGVGILPPKYPISSNCSSSEKRMMIFGGWSVVSLLLLPEEQDIKKTDKKKTGNRWEIREDLAMVK